MRIGTIISGLALVMLMTSPAITQPLVVESFNYPATIDGLGTASDGWGGAWAIDPTDNGVEGLAVIAANVFSYDDLNWVLPDTGNHVQVTKINAWGDHQRYKRPLAENWANTAGEQLWVSYMLDVKEPLPLGNTYFMVKLYNNTDEIMAIGKGGGRDDNPPVYTCGSGWPGSSGDDVSDVEIVGGPVWLVVRIDMSGNAAGDSRTFMWVDPDPTAEPDTSTADVKRNSNMFTGVNTIGFEYGGDTAGGQLIFDEIKLASSYADLTAEAPQNQVIAESFIYPATIDGLGIASDGWGGAWAIDPTDNGVEGLAVIAANVFSYDDLNWVLPDTGNHVQVTKINAWGDHQRYKRPLAENWANTAGEQLWVSYMLDVKEPLPLGNTYFMVKLYNNTDEIMAIGKGGGRDDNPPVYTCGSGWPGSSGDDVSDVEIVGGPVWLVVRIDMSGNAAGDSRTFMWVDPDPTAEPDTSTADVKRNSNMFTGVNTIGFEYGGDTAGGQLIFDEIRLASTYADLSSPIPTSVDFADHLPHQFALHQNYPNPFNPVTQISYALERTGKVRLSVYDIMGREVAVLVDGVQNFGSYTLEFSAADLPSGVYFYRLVTADRVLSKKMTLIR